MLGGLSRHGTSPGSMSATKKSGAGVFALRVSGLGFWGLGV